MMQSPCLMMSRSDNIMSTSDIFGLVLPTEADPLSIEVPAGLPDPAVLARMANEFFSALPDGGNNTIREVPSQIPAISTVSVPVTATALRPEISFPSDPHFQSAPASAGPASVSPVSAPAQATLPAVPAGIFGTPSELPALGF